MDPFLSHIKIEGAPVEFEDFASLNERINEPVVDLADVVDEPAAAPVDPFVKLGGVARSEVGSGRLLDITPSERGCAAWRYDVLKEPSKGYAIKMTNCGEIFHGDALIDLIGDTFDIAVCLHAHAKTLADLSKCVSCRESKCVQTGGMGMGFWVHY